MHWLELLAALVALPRNYPKAAEHLLQACRICGDCLGNARELDDHQELKANPARQLSLMVT